MLGRSIACVFVLSCTFPDITIVENAPSSSTSAGGSASGGTGGTGGELPCTVDEDGDGAVSATACGGPDCNDEDARAKPGQTGYFDSPMLGRAPGGLAFDFDCSGAEEKDPTDLLADCTLLMNVCSGEGWDERTAVCGTVNGWMKCKTLACEAQPEPTTQLLRCH